MRPILLAGTTDAFARKLYQAMEGDLRERVRMWPDSVADIGGLEVALKSNPLVLVLGPGIVDDVGLRLAAQVDAQRTDIEVVLVQQADMPEMADALAAGVRGVLSHSADAETVRTTIGRAVAAAVRQSPSAGQHRVPDTVAPTGRVTTVVSPKGGAGKTCLSTNLAVGLASSSPRGVVIVDLDLQFGDVAYALGLRPRHTIFDAVTHGSTTLDITTLKVFLTRHQSDLYALCAPDDPARGEMIDSELVERVVTLLAADFDHVVVDTPAGLTEQTLTTLDVSTDIVLLADMDVPSVRHLSKVVRALDRLGMRHQTRHIVLNRADARVGLSMPDVAASAGLAIELELPTTKQIPVTLNEGIPIILSNPRIAFSRQILELVARIAGPSATAHRSPMKWSA
jgi:pilus assembly protein CpaE